MLSLSETLYLPISMMDLIRSDSCEKFFDRKNYLSKTDLEDQIFGSFYVLSDMTFLPPDYEKSLFKRPIIISSCQKGKNSDMQQHSKYIHLHYFGKNAT